MEKNARTAVLIVCAHRPGRSPSQRYRFEQYLPFLRSHGYTFEFSAFLSEKQDRYFYSSGKLLRKAVILLQSTIRRWRLQRRLKHYPIVFIQREAHFLGTNFFEKKAFRSGSCVIFDFDDSIWLADTSPANIKWEWLKRPGKFFDNLRNAHIVIAGNEYLAEKARPYNKNTVVIPTTIDTDLHQPLPELNSSDKVIIGWSGSISTVKHFELILPVLARIQKEMPGQVLVKLMGAHPRYEELNGLITTSWSESMEVKELNTFDIGVMPLPDDEWSKGKCGLKGLSYMACGIATVMSRTGVNSSIIVHGVNGLLASDAEDWYRQLKTLISDKTLRKKLGEAGRETVLQEFSVNANKQKYLEVFEMAKNMTPLK